MHEFCVSQRLWNLWSMNPSPNPNPGSRPDQKLDPKLEKLLSEMERFGIENDQRENDRKRSERSCALRAPTLLP